MENQPEASIRVRGLEVRKAVGMDQMDQTLSQAKTYRIVALMPDQADDLAMLGAILRDQPEFAPDPRRRGFYWIASEGLHFYVNVHEATRSVYLVASAAARLAPEALQER